MSAEIIIALIGLLASAIGSAVTYLLAKKYVGPSQEKLIMTQKEIISALEKKMEGLEADVQSLRLEVQSLRQLTVSQALTIDILTEKLRGSENPPNSIK